MSSKRFEIFLIFVSIFYFIFIAFVAYSVFYAKIELKSDGFYLENLESENLRRNKNIFFVEGEVGEENNLSDFRRACSVEAAGKKISEISVDFHLIFPARHNPDLQINLIFTSFADEMFLHSTNFSDALKSYNNIKFSFLNVLKFTKRTELRNWMKREPYWTYSTDEVAKVLGVALLSKFGGEF